MLDPDSVFLGSPQEEVGRDGLFGVRGSDECKVAILPGGEDAFAARMDSLKKATRSIRIQALVFKGDESGLRIAEVLKQKRAEGVDVRVIVDAFSNPWLQTQWMFFDLKQHGIEVEGYEAMALQWLNEIPVPFLSSHFDPFRLDKRFHEKMWIIDGETESAVAITGGLNIGNEYFRAEPDNPDKTWRDQDVIVRGDIIKDMVTAFDRNFDYLIGIKKSRGIFNTNLYWQATRNVLAKTGKVPVSFSTEDRISRYVAQLENHQPELDYRPATCRFLQNRPRFEESYIQQAYIKLFEQAQEEILIANAYFIPTPTTLNAITSTVKRCVSVTLITNSPETNDLPEISLVGRSFFKQLLAVNDSSEVAACSDDTRLEIWEWIGQKEQDATRSQGTMHSKFAIIDHELVLVGSYNLDPRSEVLNSESAIVFLEPVLGERLRRQFMREDLLFSRRVTPELATLYEAPTDPVERFRQSMGHLFKEEL
ncbi:phospholipase D-like domain-containing protein [Pseudomaricurvus sp.]|uniref:phospholipase D-like domain-containing protein n=1 Tax=Pseudomaricurvus sp. TaxID=2004510 RepID=UPI003F6BE42B